MRPSSNSSSGSDYNGGTSSRGSSEFASLPTGSPPSALESSNSSVKSGSVASSSINKRPALKSALKTHRSSPSLGVRFSLPERPPDFLEMEDETPVPPLPAKEWPLPTTGIEIRISNPSNVTITRTQSNEGPVPQENVQMIRPVLPKRFSMPAPISHRDRNRRSAPPSRYYASQPRVPVPRVLSYESTVSAPAVLDTESLPVSPSQPPSQYNPLQHYVPCQAPSCDKHYTSLLLGPTFYLPQQPYQLVRLKGLCANCASRDLNLANEKTKQTFESMRQNAGRKTLGQIAVEFEIYKQQLQEDRARESAALKTRQRTKVLKVAENGVSKKAKSHVPSSAGGEGDNEDDVWDWRYTPRPCTRADCHTQWFSPFDNKLYLLYHTPRPSSLIPLSTLCPRCARTDVEAAEERMEKRKNETATESEVAWEEWCAEMKRDRVMEIEFSEKKQESAVRKEGVVFSGGITAEIKGKEVVVESEVAGESKKKGKRGIKGKLEKVKDICVVM